MTNNKSLRNIREEQEILFLRISKYKTGNSKEALLVSTEIKDLASLLLTVEEMKDANDLCQNIVKRGKGRKTAILRLQRMASPPPKRPLYYAKYELGFLPRWTRDAIKYLGDYVNELSRHLLYQFTSAGTSNASFAKVAKELLKKQPSKLTVCIKKYNEIFYRPSEHDFVLPAGRNDHRFTASEVVYAAYITIKLAKEIRKITNCDPELRCHGSSRFIVFPS